jgi:hypothetical protein
VIPSSKLRVVEQLQSDLVVLRMKTMTSPKKLVSLSISALLIAVYLPVFIGVSTAVAESPGFGRKCSHSQFLSNATAKASNGNWYQCSGSDFSITKSGQAKRYYTWVQIENPTVTSSAKPGEICFTPFETVRTKVGKLKCQPVRARPPVYMWVKQ